jgi:amidohydrolase
MDQKSSSPIGLGTILRNHAAIAMQFRSRLKSVVVGALPLYLVFAAQAQSPVVDRFGPRVTGLVNGMYPQLDTFYKDIHAHPELGFQETRTAAKLAAEMRALGFQVTEKVGKTGVVAIFKNGPGPTVLVRTELDALPMEEKTGLPYASEARAQSNGRESFVAHSCGHDIHMASWVGAARTLVSLKDEWQGTLMFVAQPAEELITGAKAMLADGLFTRFGKPDVAFALHTGPQAFGTVISNIGAVTSNTDRLEITFRGRGGHASAPDKTIDPIAMAAHFITDVQTVVSREKDPMEFGVITIGAVEAGTVGNIIPDTAVLRGSIRSYDSEVRAKLLDGVRRTARAVALMAGAPEPTVVLNEGGLAVINNERVVGSTESVLAAALGAKNVTRGRPNTASDDFSAFVNEGVPSMLFVIGVHDPRQVAEAARPGGQSLPVNHSPLFAPIPEPSIKTGVRAMSLAVLSMS